MLNGKTVALVTEIREIREEVASRGGPTVPPSGVSRRAYLKALDKADAALVEAIRLLSPLAKPDYTSPEPVDEGA